MEAFVLALGYVLSLDLAESLGSQIGKPSIRSNTHQIMEKIFRARISGIRPEFLYLGEARLWHRNPSGRCFCLAVLLRGYTHEKNAIFFLEVMEPQADQLADSSPSVQPHPG